MSDYTVVEPRFELFDPCTLVNYMQFLELCTRNCYKSEGNISPGSAEKLLKKVTTDFGHYSVTEHANCIIKISDDEIVDDLLQEFALYNPLLRLSFREEYRSTLLISGNIRMWKDFQAAWPPPGQRKCHIGHGIDSCLDIQWPFFFTSNKRAHQKIKLVDCNPMTNNNNLTTEEMLKHMTMTGRFVGSRTMSHQLVRHRLAAYCVDGDAITELTIEGVQRNGRRFKQIKKRSIKQLFNMKKTSHGRSRLKLVKLNCLNEETGEITQGRVKDVVYSGKKRCIEIITKDGYKIRTTKDHRFLTPEGWKRLQDILEKNLPVSTNGITMPSPKWLKEEYLTKNRLRSAIAKELCISDAWLGKYIAKHNLQKPKALYLNRKPGRGRPGMHSKDGCEAISKRMKGSGNHRWRGGITKHATKIRQEKITSELRKTIYTRDDYTCRLCHTRGEMLVLHHIIPIWQNETLIDDERNLITLCKKCHEGKVNNHEHEFEEYFKALEPVKPRPLIKKTLERQYAKFSKIVSHGYVGKIDTYDIVMSNPHHNFIANGFVVHNSQESQRYCNYGKKGLQVICPPEIKNMPTALGNWAMLIAHANDAYNELLSSGIPPEDARSVLPNATKTEVVATYTLGMWKHLIEHRGHNHKAQWEIKDLCLEAEERLHEVIPTIF